MRMKLSLAAAAVGLGLAAPAYAVTYVTNTATYTGLGDSIGSPFDQITLGGVTGSASGPGVYLVNNVDFTVGINATSDGFYSGILSDTAMINGSIFTYNIAYNLAISSADTITLGGNSFVTNGYRVTFNPLTLTAGVGSTVSGQLYATVAAVPEPAAWVLMIGGIGLIGGAMRRQKANVSVSYA